MTRLLAVGLLVAFVASASAQPTAKRLLDVDDLYRLDGPQASALSPNGQALVYVRQWIDLTTRTERQSLWQVAGSEKKAAALEPDEPDARAPVFSPDGKWIAFLSTRTGAPDWRQIPKVPIYSDPATDVWLMSASCGPAIPLTDPEAKNYGRVFNDGFYGRLAFSPDSTRLAFIADTGRDPSTDAEKRNAVRVVRDDQGEGYTGYGTAQLWVAHLLAKPDKFAASKVERLTTDDVWYGDPQWTPDGKSLIVHANKTNDRESARFSINKNFALWDIDTATKTQRQLTTGPGPEVFPRVSPDGTKIACLSIPRKGTHRDTFNLAIVDISEKQPKTRVVFDHHAKPDIKPPHPPVQFPLPLDCWDGNGRLYAAVEAGTWTLPRMINLTTAAAESVDTVYIPVPGTDLKTLAGRQSIVFTMTPPGNVFLNEVAASPQKTVEWKSTDGLEIDGVLTLPPEETKLKPPYKLIVFPHGGPHGRSMKGFDFTVQVFTAKGYAVFQPNFRGSTGYGQKFIDADRGDFGGGDMRDILSGVDHLIAAGVADKNRLFVYGTSYGGFMTSWLIGQTDRFRAAVPVNAVTDLNMMWGLSDLQSWTEWEFGGKPWEVPEKMRKHSPISYVGNVKTPTLVLHARDDRRVPLPMGVAYHKALKSRGVPTEMVIYPDEGHGIRQPRHREDVLRRVLAWFEKYDAK